jgi:amidohydrolase
MCSEVFERYSAIVEKYRDLILATEKYLYTIPETGFKEFKTSKYLEDEFEKLGYVLHRAEGITGFYTDIDTGRPGPKVLVFGELDSVICAEHPCADKETGAVHACGHHCQTSALLGVAAALKEDGVLDKLSGKIKLCAVPAEEMLEIEFRSNLMEKGIIKFFGGKTEFLSRGYFDDVDMAFMLHTRNEFTVTKGAVGFITKRVIYKGKAAHAGGSPHDGKNALYAATSGLNSANALRETFRDDDIIRFHPIITEGGQMVNAIPEKVAIESYVRGKTYDVIAKANKRINQAFCGGALSLNTNVEIIDTPGYAPYENDVNMSKVYQDAYSVVFNGEKVRVYDNMIEGGASDIGDLACVMPIVQPYCSGVTGDAHGNNFYVNDIKSATIDNAKVQVIMLALLLKDGAKRAKEVVANYDAPFKSTKEYLDFLEQFFFLHNCGKFKFAR